MGVERLCGGGEVCGSGEVVWGWRGCVGVERLCGGGEVNIFR